MTGRGRRHSLLKRGVKGVPHVPHGAPAGQQAVQAVAVLVPPAVPAPVAPPEETYTSAIVFWDVKSCPVPENLTVLEVVA